MEKTAYTRLLEHIAHMGERENALGLRIDAINDEIRALGATYEAAVLADEGAPEIEDRIHALEAEAAQLTRQRQILARGERSPTTTALAQSVVDENRNKIKAMQADYDARLGAVITARKNYVQAIADIGAIARSGAALSREAQQAAGYLPPPKPYIALHEPITGNRLTVDQAQFKAAYEGIPTLEN